MKINIRVRMKNPWFWIGIISVVLAAMGVEPEMFTSWGTVWSYICDLFTNPFRLGTVVVAVLGIFVDPTTAGVSDSEQAMTYTAPKK